MHEIRFVYVADKGNNRIDKFSPTGKPVWYTNGLHAMPAKR
jgi:hypothetical protein